MTLKPSRPPGAKYDLARDDGVHINHRAATQEGNSVAAFRTQILAVDSVLIGST